MRDRNTEATIPPSRVAIKNFKPSDVHPDGNREKRREHLNIVKHHYR